MSEFVSVWERENYEYSADRLFEVSWWLLSHINLKLCRFIYIRNHYVWGGQLATNLSEKLCLEIWKATICETKIKLNITKSKWFGNGNSF